jgi:hypothetical protein
MNEKIDFDLIYDLVRKHSEMESRGGLLERGLKLSEESGELSAEILKSIGFKYHKNTPDEIRQGILLESIDCLIMVFDILNFGGYSKEEILKMAESQLAKWKKQIEQ